MAMRWAWGGIVALLLTSAPAHAENRPADPAIGAAEAAKILFPEDAAKVAACTGADVDVVRCLLRAFYKDDASASDLAIDLYGKSGSVAGIEVEHEMDGGYRGRLHLVPAIPTGANRVHLARVARALTDYDAFFASLVRQRSETPRYRWRGLSLRFFRSVKARTPSAYAHGWTIAYNVSGSLNGDDDQVRETMFHEVFHLNDAAHGDWSARALGPAYDAIVARCKTNTACLAPFAPNSTKVKGGTYYAFQPGNGVGEYAAELAVRYYREQRGALGQGPRVAPAFKCMRQENTRAWDAFVREFFGGIDHVPACS